MWIGREELSNKIQRISSYEDARFAPHILRQRGAFVVDDKYIASFRIVNEDSAVVFFDPEINMDELIDEFRFYTEHIVNFYDGNMELIKSFPPMEIFYVNLEDIQPSQFYVDEDKVQAVADFINSEADIYIPIARIGDRLVSCDGHTRLYYAATRGYTKLKAFFADPGDYLAAFAEEARKRNVHSPYDLELISHDEYEKKWHDFCDNFFQERGQG